MPLFVEVTYKCGCTGYGNPDFNCPRHGQPVKEKGDLDIYIDTCSCCKKKFQSGEQFVWRPKKAKSLSNIEAMHVRCLLKKTGWVESTEGKFIHVVFKKDKNIVKHKEEVSLCTPW